MSTGSIRNVLSIRCVKKMDHHCPWINICVGHDNHTAFIGFLFFLIVGCIHAVAINSTFLYRLFSYVSQLSLMLNGIMFSHFDLIFTSCYTVLYEPPSLIYVLIQKQLAQCGSSLPWERSVCLWKRLILIVDYAVSVFGWSNWNHCKKNKGSHINFVLGSNWISVKGKFSC